MILKRGLKTRSVGSRNDGMTFLWSYSNFLCRGGKAEKVEKKKVKGKKAKENASVEDNKRHLELLQNYRWVEYVGSYA